MFARLLRSRVFLLCVVLFAAVLAVFVWWRGAGDDQPQWLTAPVVRKDLEDAVLATGTIQASRLVSVGAQASGQVKVLHVQEGDVVQSGQLIAEIDSTTQQNTLNDELAALESIQAQRKSLQAALKLAQAELKRQQEMFAHEATSRAELQAAQNALASAQAQLQVNATQIKQANTRIATARTNLGYTRIVAPMDGTVVAIVTEEGQTVNAVQSAPTIVKLAKLDVVKIEAEISEADVPRVAPGMPAYFTLLGEPDKRHEATLLSIAPAPASLATESITTSSASSSSAVYYNGVLQSPNDDGKLRISMTAQVFIIAAQAKDALSVPSSALGAKDADGRYEVRVLTRGAKPADVQTRKVEIGLNNRVDAQVLGGLQEGDTVLLNAPRAGADANAAPQPRPPRMRL